MSSTVSMTISLAVPYLIYLSVHGKAIPFIVIGSVAIIAGILASFLPETLNENLPQTISDAEEFGKNQKFFSWNRRRRSISRERAASLALQLKGFDNLGLKEENIIKSKPKSQILHNGDFLTNRKISTDSEEKKSNRLSLDPGLNCAPQKPPVTYRHSLSESDAAKVPATESGDQSYDNKGMSETNLAPNVVQHVEDETSGGNSRPF